MPTPAEETSVRETVRSFIGTNFYLPDPAALTDDTSFLASGIVDSTGVLEVVTFVEHTFCVVVEDTELLPKNLDSVNALVAFVMAKRGSLP